MSFLLFLIDPVAADMSGTGESHPICSLSKANTAHMLLKMAHKNSGLWLSNGLPDMWIQVKSGCSPFESHTGFLIITTSYLKSFSSHRRFKKYFSFWGCSLSPLVISFKFTDNFLLLEWFITTLLLYNIQHVLSLWISRSI